jgi:hypothetical protein
LSPLTLGLLLFDCFQVLLDELRRFNLCILQFLLAGKLLFDPAHAFIKRAFFLTLRLPLPKLNGNDVAVSSMP